jgi:hypothetical protein
MSCKTLSRSHHEGSDGGELSLRRRVLEIKLRLMGVTDYILNEVYGNHEDRISRDDDEDGIPDFPEDLYDKTARDGKKVNQSNQSNLILRGKVLNSPFKIN